MPYIDKFHYFHPDHGVIGGKPPSDPKELNYWLWRCSGGNKSRKNAQINNNDNSLSLCHSPVPRTINGVIKIGNNLTVQPHEESAESAKSKLNQKDNSKSCPYCSLSFNPQYLERHIYKQHRELKIFLKKKANVKSFSNNKSKEQPQLLACPYCAVSVSQQRLKKHIKKVHPAKNNLLNSKSKAQSKVLSSPSSATNVNQKRSKKHLKKVISDKNYINATSERYDCADWYECNTVDPIDGSKYLGFERREYKDSRFGSFPLHDDYGDESGAD